MTTTTATESGSPRSRGGVTRGAVPPLALALILTLAIGPMAPTRAADLDIGDRAPEFELEGSDGTTHTLADYRGQAVVLAWFPKAFTGG